MRDLLIAVSMLLVLGAGEGALWLRNPMHVPEGFMPARACGFQVFRELDGSMEPAVAVGRHVLVSSWSYWWNEPQVGDVVAFAYPRDPAVADLKRIVAQGGSTVEIKQGVVYVDGKPLERGSTAELPSRFYRLAAARVVPPDSYFVLGDNPAQSEDSRSYGFVPRGLVIGKRWL
jgi:signal peptidase I